MKPKLPAGTLKTLWSNPANWRYLWFYSCKEDPRLVVPKRNAWGGWTMNFAHGASWLFTLFVVAYVVAPIVTLTRMGLLNGWIWYGTLIGIGVVTVGLCWFMASPGRFEEKS